jgi:hypothetical protein
VGHGGAAAALDREWEVVEAADDGNQGLRRGSGEGSRAEEGRRSNAARCNG